MLVATQFCSAPFSIQSAVEILELPGRNELTDLIYKEKAKAKH